MNDMRPIHGRPPTVRIVSLHRVRQPTDSLDGLDLISRPNPTIVAFCGPIGKELPPIVSHPKMGVMRRYKRERLAASQNSQASNKGDPERLHGPTMTTHKPHLKRRSTVLERLVGNYEG